MNQHSKGLYVDENVVRIVAVQVIFVTIIAVVEQLEWLSFLLALDFGIRAFTHFPSPLALFSKKVTEIAKSKPQPIFAPPKRFAAALGFTFSLVIAILTFFQLTFASYLVGGILVVCALLESAFKICLGCYVFNYLVLPIQNKIQNK